MADKKPKLRIKDDANTPETYANKLIGVSFDGSAVSVMLGVTRFVPEKTDDPPAPGQHPTIHLTSRLVLSPPAVVELVNSLTNLLSTIATLKAPAGTKQ